MLKSGLCNLFELGPSGLNLSGCPYGAIERKLIKQETYLKDNTKTGVRGLTLMCRYIFDQTNKQFSLYENAR